MDRPVSTLHPESPSSPAPVSPSSPSTPSIPTRPSFVSRASTTISSSSSSSSSSTPSSAPSSTPSSPSSSPRSSSKSAEKHATFSSIAFFANPPLRISTVPALPPYPPSHFPLYPPPESLAPRTHTDTADWGDAFHTPSPVAAPELRARLRRWMIRFVPVAFILGALQVIFVSVGLRPTSFGNPAFFGFFIAYGVMTMVFALSNILVLKYLRPSHDDMPPPLWSVRLMLSNLIAHGLASLTMVAISVMVVSPNMDFGLEDDASDTASNQNQDRGRFPLGGGVARGIWVAVCLVAILNCVLLFTWYRAAAVGYRSLRGGVKRERDDQRVAELRDVRKRDEEEAGEVAAPQWPLA